MAMDDTKPAGSLQSRLARLARPSGAFAMVAIDQRESLRAMLGAHASAPIPDASLTEFKMAVIQQLEEHASALLVDVPYALAALMARGGLPATCGLVVAADRLIQAPGGPVDSTELDEEAIDLAVAAGAAAVKLLVIWTTDEANRGLGALVERFLTKAHAAGLLGIVETIVHKPPMSSMNAWDREAALIEAARVLGAYKPDLYKCQVPFLGQAVAADIEATATRLTAALPCPWVVLSSGVPADRFGSAVAACGRAGASGFLAGRAIWADTIGYGDYQDRLAQLAVPRLRDLAKLVDRSAVPWHQALQRSAEQM